MKRLALALFLLTAVASFVTLLVRPGAEASPDATITVNSTADTDSRDGVITLREAMLLVTGGRAVSTLDEGECHQVSNSTYGPPCSTTDTIGAASADTIILSVGGVIRLGSTLPALNTGGDTVDASSSGAAVEGQQFDCFEITSSGNTIKGLKVFSLRTAIYIHSGAQGNTIGGITTPGECNGDCNWIQGQDAGVEISGTGTSGNVLSGNRITALPRPQPTPAVTPTPTGNHPQVVVRQGAHDNTIGGTVAAQANTIANSWDVGLRVDGVATVANCIRGNSIHSSVGKGIENINGGNMELAPPVIDSVGSVLGHTDPKCYPCTVEVFSDDEDEGRIYHGSTTTNDDVTGTWTYPGGVTGPNITATITDASGNTSEFSAPVAYSPPAVGGIAELADASGSSGDMMIAVAGLAAPAVVILILSASYARRRWGR